jgi:hypothetical protein
VHGMVQKPFVLETLLSALQGASASATSETRLRYGATPTGQQTMP